MVCNRCIEAVQEEFEKLDVPINSIKLGEVQIEQNLTTSQLKYLSTALHKRGFELLEDKQSQLIEHIKSALIQLVHYHNKPLKLNYSTFLEKEIGRDYHSLSTLFSLVEGITIEKFIILQKIEKVKELLIYDELSLSQIAIHLNYSSVHHLSNQFKKTTGMTPSQFKKNHTELRKSLDQVK